MCLFSTNYWCNRCWNCLIGFIIPPNMVIDTKSIWIPCIVNEILTKMRFSVMASLICLFSQNCWRDLHWNGFIRLLIPQNMVIDTKIILIPCIVAEILTKTTFSVMAALICILCGLPKDDRVASSGFLKSTPQSYRNNKKTLYGPQCKVLWKYGVWQPDYTACFIRFNLLQQAGQLNT